MASAPIPQAPLMTAEQLLDLPDDGMRHELVEGTLRTMTPAAGEHGRIGTRLLNRIGVFVETERLGEVFTAETGFWLGGTRTRSGPQMWPSSLPTT